MIIKLLLIIIWCLSWWRQLSIIWLIWPHLCICIVDTVPVTVCHVTDSINLNLKFWSFIMLCYGSVLLEMTPVYLLWCEGCAGRCGSLWGWNTDTSTWGVTRCSVTSDYAPDSSWRWENSCAICTVRVGPFTPRQAEICTVQIDGRNAVVYYNMYLEEFQWDCIQLFCM